MDERDYINRIRYLEKENRRLLKLSPSDLLGEKIAYKLDRLNYMLASSKRRVKELEMKIAKLEKQLNEK